MSQNSGSSMFGIVFLLVIVVLGAGFLVSTGIQGQQELKTAQAELVAVKIQSEQDLANRDAQIIALKEAGVQSQKTLDDKVAEIVALKQQLVDKQVENDQLQADHQVMNSALTEKTSELEQVSAELMAKQVELNQLQSQNQILADEKLDLRTQIDQAQTKVEHMQAQIFQLQSKNNELARSGVGGLVPKVMYQLEKSQAVSQSDWRLPLTIIFGVGLGIAILFSRYLHKTRKTLLIRVTRAEMGWLIHQRRLIQHRREDVER